jgi:dimethylhistidine N-methyltransferase
MFPDETSTQQIRLSVQNETCIRDLHSITKPKTKPHTVSWMFQVNVVPIQVSPGGQMETSEVNRKSLYVEPGALSDFAREVLEGLSASPKAIPSRWLYDSEGSRLFARICELDEYYPTRREAGILRDQGHAIAAQIGPRPVVVMELGAGDGRKTRFLLSALLAAKTSFTYMPIDVSREALETLCARLGREFGPSFREQHCRPFLGDNLEASRTIGQRRAELGGLSADRRLAVFLGSSIGNQSKPELERFLGALRATLHDGDLLLIGFDLVKDPARLFSAYSDASGVTRDFNLNLLERMNRELGANFDARAFGHHAIWNPEIEGMESWLIAERDQTVSIRAVGRSFEIRKWEGIRTEISLKFRDEDLMSLAARTGFHQRARFIDPEGDFADALWEARDRRH